MKLLLGTLLAVASIPAMAEASATASLTELRYELVDLDPNDGITPTVKFTGQSLVRVKSGGYCTGCKDFGSFTEPASVSFPNGSAAASQAGLSAFSQSGSFGFTAESLPYLGSDRYQLKSIAIYQGALGMPLFQLSAHTGLRITGQYTLDAEVDPYRNPSPLLRGLEYGTASVFFSSRFIDGDDALRSITAKSDWHSPADSAHESGEISVLMRNDLSHQATLWGKWGVIASSAVPGVPEPSTYALMLAGLALVGVTARRRQERRER
ncbi:PEPxxWA-CTERM sorting domain-containing protein [Azohydromonas lata]|uniref:PEPxxWA-CTERM sorting domain-containing protein n=1 Tax=Azohydromonas lata TaxID=45677 RepID=UPI00082A968A|nr:PEPxxWA-CTERM sorting domain-containing protein [Azohydromonas lata]